MDTKALSSLSQPAIDRLVQDAAQRRLTRRQVLKRGVGLGLSAPAIAALLAACGSSSASNKSSSSSTSSAAQASTSTNSSSTTGTAAAAGASPTPASGSSGTPSAATPAPAGSSAASAYSGKRGQDGMLKLLWWQAPVTLNPHLGGGQKDTDASMPILEPLADFDANANLYPKLAAEVPSLTNGGVAKDGLSVTWKLRPDVVWADGKPFTAADVKFTYDYISDPKTAAVSIASYTNVKAVQVVDDHTVTVTFKKPEPAWFTPFTGGSGLILPKHVLNSFVGANAKSAPFNLKPVGTGPYKIDSFTPGDVGNYSVNDHYRESDKPYFAQIQLKGGGDATSAARAVFQTGEYDYAWNLQIDPNVLKAMQSHGLGYLAINHTLYVEQISINFSDPNKTVDGQKSHLGTPHPFQSDLKVRQAYALAVPRDVVASKLYGATGAVATNLLAGPPQFASKNTSWKYDLATAGKLLDDAGWVKGSDGVRAKNGVKMAITYQTTVNAVRQSNQEIVKNSFGQLGIQVTLKSIDASVYFSPSAGNTDTAQHFYADLEMEASEPQNPYPINYMAYWYGAPSNIAQKENQWSGNNFQRYQNPAYDKLYEQAQVELDPAKQSELFIKMNDTLVNDVAAIPEVRRFLVGAAAKTLTGINLSPWTSDLWLVADWHRQKG